MSIEQAMGWYIIHDILRSRYINKHKWKTYVECG